MEPNKNIPSFCFESPWLKPFSFEISSVEVTAGERRIRATWTPELAQDVSAFHNIDAEAELTRLLNEELLENNIRTNTLVQDLLAIQPMEVEPIEAPVVYKDGSWSYDNIFEGFIGIKSEIKSHTFI
jgi:hypothetical protein